MIQNEGYGATKRVMDFKINQVPVCQNNRASILHQWINKWIRIHKHPEGINSDIYERQISRA